MRPDGRYRRTVGGVTVVPESLRALVDGGTLAHVATLDPDGSPQVTVVWVGWDGDDLVSGHMSKRRKVSNAMRDPRAVVSLEAPKRPGEFLTPYAVLTVTVAVEEGGAWDLLNRLAKVYLGADATFPAPRADGGFVLRYRITRIGGVGPWVPTTD